MQNPDVSCKLWIQNKSSELLEYSLITQYGVVCFFFFDGMYLLVMTAKALPLDNNFLKTPLFKKVF